MTRLRKLCIVNPFEHGGGAEFQIRCLVELLAQRKRFELFYLAHHVRKDATNPHYRVVRIGGDERAPRLGYLCDAMPLYRALKSIEPDAIYQRVAGGYTGICAFYARRHHVPLIWHVAHDSDVQPQAIAEGRNPLRPILEKRSVEYAIRRADYIVVQKREQEALLRQNYGRSADIVLPNFHPLPTEPLDKASRPTVLWIANLKRWKQPEVFVRLAAALADTSARFVMVGAPSASSTDAQWNVELSNAIRATPNLEYLGEQPHDAVNALLAQSHLFVNTSLHEGFPNTFIQAWMRKVPVVSLHVDPDGVLGSELVGVKAASEQSLIEAVRGLLSDPSRRIELGENAQHYAQRKHSVQSAQPLTELLESCAPRPAH